MCENKNKKNMNNLQFALLLFSLSIPHIHYKCQTKQTAHELCICGEKIHPIYIFIAKQKSVLPIYNFLISFLQQFHYFFFFFIYSRLKIAISLVYSYTYMIYSLGIIFSNDSHRRRKLQRWKINVISCKEIDVTWGCTT